MTFAQILPFACFAALPLLAGALWLLNRTGFLAAGTKHLFFRRRRTAGRLFW